MCFAMVLRCLSGVVLSLWLSSASWAEEARSVEVQSSLGEPLSAWLAPSASPAEPAAFEVESTSAVSLKVAPAAEGARLHLTSEHPIVDPVVQGTLRWVDPTGEGAMPFVLLLDPPPQQATLPVPPGATLWRLAAQWAGPPGSTQAERMRALQAANPDAFLDGDPNRLRADAVLRLPRYGGDGAPAPERFAPAVAPAGPRLEVSPPEAADRLAEERTALAAALARAEADRQAAVTAQAEQAAELAQLRDQLAQQRDALSRLQAQLEGFQRAQALPAQGEASSAPLPKSPATEAFSRVLEQAALGLSALAVALGALLLWRRPSAAHPAASPPAGSFLPVTERPEAPGLVSEQIPERAEVPESPAAALAGEGGGQPYTPSELVQRYGAQSLLSQRDWEACLDQVEMAIAYGRLDEAEALLSAAREEDPHAVPLRLKVLELAVERQDRPSFDAVAPGLLRGADPALKRQIEALADRLPSAALQAEAPPALRLAPGAMDEDGEHG